MALPLQDAQVLSRFGEQNYIRLHNLGEPEAEEFMRSLLSEWVDPQRRDELIAKFSEESEGEEIKSDTFRLRLPDSRRWQNMLLAKAAT